nr:fimbrial protein [uncultured Erwinia sp.]
MFIWRIPAAVLLIGACLHCYAIDKGATMVQFSGQVVDQNPCKINNDEQVLVPFGNILQKNADGKQIQKKLNINVKCTGVNNDALKMQIVGTTSFSDNVLETDMDDLGIVFYQNGSPVKLHTWFDLPQPAESLLLTASPIIQNGKSMGGGEFKATATLLVNIQ